MVRALITGIDGFVGRFLAMELHNHNYEVFGTSVGPDHDSVHHLELTDADGVSAVLQKIEPELIFHLAGFTSVKQSWDQPDEALKINRDGTKNLYQAAALLPTAPRFLITSTAEVYDVRDARPLTEASPTGPKNPYAQSKLAQEHVAEDFPGLPTNIVRSFPHIGPGQSPTFVASDFARQIVAVERAQAHSISVGNLEAQRDFTDVRDVVRAYRLVMESSTGQIFNVCSGHVMSIKDILDALLAQSTQSVTVTQDPARLRPSDIPVLAGDATKLRLATGWKPEISIEQTTLPEILTYWRQQP